jgi:hypothetical protein
MQEREYLRLKREIEERCRKDLESLERVWELSKATEGPHRETGDGIKRGDLQNAIIRAIGQFASDFTAEQMHAKIKVTNPEIGEKAKPSSVSSALNRMEGNEIEVVIRGVGRKPSVYRVKKPDLKVVGS